MRRIIMALVCVTLVSCGAANPVVVGTITTDAESIGQDACASWIPGVAAQYKQIVSDASTACLISATQGSALIQKASMPFDLLWPAAKNFLDSIPPCLPTTGGNPTAPACKTAWVQYMDSAICGIVQGCNAGLLQPAV